MTSAQSSQEIWCSIDSLPQTSGISQAHYRSAATESKGSSDEDLSRRDDKSVDESNQCHGQVHECDAVRVFSRHAATWVKGELSTFCDDRLVTAEYAVGEDWCRKVMHVHSPHISIPPSLMNPPPEWHLLEACPSQAMASVSHQTSPSTGISANGCAFQGCRNGLPIECGGDPVKYYLDMDYIWTLLERRHVVLIRGGWLLERSQIRPFSPLPCFQDLPSEAIVSITNLQQADAELSKVEYWRKHTHDPTRKSIVAISHCWLDSNHPDPDGSLLQELVLPIQAYLDDIWQWPSLQDFDGAFFIAWCSIIQPYHAQTGNGQYTRLEKACISHDQQELHNAALANMDIWYAHQSSEVWMMTKFLPSQVIPYEERGWPTWEHIVSELLTDGDALFDIGKLDTSSLGDAPSYTCIMEACKSSRRPPIIPEEFEKQIDKKHFTCGGCDRELIKENYRRNFAHVMSCVKQFRFDNLSWSTHEVTLLCLALDYCAMLQDLDLTGNHIGVPGMRSLAAALCRCRYLRSLTLDQNMICDSGACELAATLTNFKKLEWLCLADNQIGDVGAGALGQTLQHCANLEFIRLKKNHISDIGMCALGNALCSCRNLQWLVLTSNRIGDDGARCISEILRHCSILSRLALGDNQIGESGASALAQALHHCASLLGLELYGNRIHDAGAWQLAQTLHHCERLERLNLDSNQLTDDGVWEIAKRLYHCGNLQVLSVAENMIGDVGAQALAKALCQCAELQWLSLNGNQITDHGACSLAKNLQNCENLTYVDIQENLLSDAGCCVLSQGLPHCWVSAS